MENAAQYAPLSSSAMQKKAIIAKFKASGLAKLKPEEEEDNNNEDQEYNFEKLKTFHIPRKKEQPEGKALLTALPLESREYIHTLFPAIKSSFLYPQSSRHIRILKVELVNNPLLLKEFLDKKKDMKDEGRTEKELSESFCFLHSSNSAEASKICENGLSIGNSGLVSLGKPKLGVYVCKHADVISSSPVSSGDSGFIIVFKFIKGKTKLVTENKAPTTIQEPTPLYDCHLTKWTGEGTKANHTRAFQALQYYVYEYGELDLEDRPRQILPYAVLHYTSLENDRTGQQKDLVNSSSMDVDQNNKFPASTPGIGVRTFCLWKGKLLVKGGSFCNVEIRTDNDSAANKAFLDNSINVKMVLSVANFSRQLPATFLNKSGKKHNVVYRGRNYNIFTLIPADEAGFGKFRQLIASLVQNESVAVVPLRMASCIYLIPNSNLTVNKMGLLPPSGSNDKPNTQFLYALVVTPKLLTTKINDQKIYNLITVRKRRDPHSENKVPEELDQKLRSMNIESSSAAGALASEQHEKLLFLLKDKKRLQISEKLLHNHYKESVTFFASKDSYQKFIEACKSNWSMASQARLDYYKPKENKTPSNPPHKSILKPGSSNEPKPSYAKPSKQSYLDVPVEGVAEATFSDEDDMDGLTKSFTSRSKSISGKQSVAKSTPDKRKLEIDAKSSPPIKFSRPSFKALVEIILTATVEELMLHPDFVFSERFEKTHRVTKESGFSDAFDIDQEKQISVQFRQQVPFLISKDCPYAHENNPVVKSMIRALYGTWEENDESSEDQEKVNWVRDVLHKNKSSSHHTVTSHVDRTVSDDVGASKELSPSAPGSSSADSGFASSSTTTTPNAVFQQNQAPGSSLNDIADMLVTVLQEKIPMETIEAMGSENDVQATTQSIIKALVTNLNENGQEIPIELKNIVDQLAAPPEKADEADLSASRESSPEPGLLSSSSSNSSPIPDPFSNHSPANSLKASDPVAGYPQDPRLNKAPASLPRLPLPSYRFPPSEKAAELLPKDGEAARKIRLLPKTLKEYNNPGLMKATTTDKAILTGIEKPTSSYQGAIDLKSIPGIAIKKKSRALSTKSQTIDPGQSTKSQTIDPGQSTISFPGTRTSGIMKTIGDTSTGSATNAKQFIDAVLANFMTTMSTASNSTTPRDGPVPDLTGSGPPVRERIGGNTANKKLSSILRPPGQIPASILTAQFTTQSEKTLPKALGILRGMHGKTHGQPEKSGIVVTRNTGQVVRLIDDKRMLHDTDDGSAPLGSNRSRDTLSSKLPLVASRANFNAPEATSAKLGTENFKIVRQVAATDQPSNNDSPQATSHAKSDNPPQRDDSEHTLRSLDSSSHDVKNSTVNETLSLNVKPEESAASSSPKQLTDIFPENYIKKIHRKFKQQQELRKKQGLIPTLKSEQLKQPATEIELEKDDTSIAMETEKHEVSATETTSTRSPSLVSSPGVTPSQSTTVDTSKLQANEKVVEPPKDDLVSEISQVLQNVKNVREGASSADDLSSKLLQLAMQLRGGSVTPASLPVSSSTEEKNAVPGTTQVPAATTTSNIPELPSQVVDTQKSLDPTPAASQDTQQMNRTGDQNSVNLFAQQSLPIPVIDTFKKHAIYTSQENQIGTINNASDPFSSVMDGPIQPIQVVEPQVRLDQSVIGIDYSRDTATPTLDDTDDPNRVQKVNESYTNTYKNLKPLSSTALSKVVISDDIKRILKRIADPSTLEKSVEAGVQTTSATPTVTITSSPTVTTSSLSNTAPTKSESEHLAVKRQKIAHVKPQPSQLQPHKSYYVFNPRNHVQCDRIADVLAQSGHTFQMHDIADAIADSLADDDNTLVQVTTDMLDRALGNHTLWIVIRSSDVELMPALPHLSLLKCAGPKVNFIQVDSAEEVNAKKYSNIMAGELGIIMPVSMQVLIGNRVTIVGLLAWMLDLYKKKGKPLWRLALPKHIHRQLKSYRDNSVIDDSVKSASIDLLEVIRDYNDVIIEANVTDEPSDDVSTTEVFDAAISLQMHYVHLTRHVVVLIENEESNHTWNTHRRAGIAVTTVDKFVTTIIEEKKRGPQENRVYSPLMKIYKVEK